MSISTHVIILAQGQQQRLPGVVVPKQLLELAAHRAMGFYNTTILHRTIAMAGEYLKIDDHIDPSVHHMITVVGTREVRQALRDPARLPILGRSREGYLVTLVPHVVTLPDPGNSSLVGLSRFLEGARQDIGDEHWPERTVVLLGDVLYSWSCLTTLMQKGRDAGFVFAGTPQLSEQDGEIFGVSWGRTAEPLMMTALRHALAKGSQHEDVYQCGQLRLWAWDLGIGRHWVIDPGYAAIDDYTMDVDEPQDLVDLAAASLQAIVDDKEHGCQSYAAP